MNSKRLAIIFVLIAVILILVIRSFLYIFPIQSSGVADEGMEEALFHVALLLDESNENSLELAELITSEGMAHGIAVELWYENEQTASDRLKTMQYAKVDGLILDAAFVSELQETGGTEASSIKVVSLGNYDSKVSAVVNVGYNAYDIGRQVGSMIHERLANEMDEEIVLLHDIFGDAGSLSGSFQMGLKESLTDVQMTVVNGDVKAEYYRYSAKTFVMASSSSETIALVREISKQGLQERCRVIGYGDHEDIKSYVDRGIIEGSVVYDSQLLSDKAVDVMTKLLKDKLVSETNHIAVKMYEVKDEDR